MDNSMYSALFGALTQEHRMDMIANNLSNVDTTGFKKDQSSFKDEFIRFASDYADPNMTLQDRVLWPDAKLLSQTRLSGDYIDFNQGSLQDTGNPLDLAIDGEGFFRVRTPDGQEAYTRAGSFRINSETNTLETPQGYTLLGDGGEVEIPENARVTVNGQGQIIADGDVIADVGLVTFEDLRALEKQGENLFRIREDAQAQEIPAENARVCQGYLEGSNVEVVREMVNMIDTMRTFESLQKSMTTSKEADDKVIRQVGSYT
ncbi:MAG: flagellar basal-body rod protein FlgF [Desulfonatronovibrionaceae bacterium]